MSQSRLTLSDAALQADCDRGSRDRAPVARPEGQDRANPSPGVCREAEEGRERARHPAGLLAPSSAHLDLLRNFHKRLGSIPVIDWAAGVPLDGEGRPRVGSAASRNPRTGYARYWRGGRRLGGPCDPWRRCGTDRLSLGRVRHQAAPGIQLPRGQRRRPSSVPHGLFAVSVSGGDATIPAIC